MFRIRAQLTRSSSWLILVVSRNRMHAPLPIALVGLALFLCGCATPSHHPGGLVGTWSCPVGGETIQAHLQSSGHWEWRGSFEVSHSRPPTQSGRWFVFDEILVLRVEKSAAAEIPPGIAYTYDLRRVLPDKIILFDLNEESEKTWTRTANKVTGANSRPAPSLDAGRQFGRASCAPSLLSAAVAQFWRWPGL